MNADYKALFLEETQVQLKEWEDALLALEEKPGDAALLSQLRRALHTLKGCAGFVERGDLQSLAHDLESIIPGDGDAAGPPGADIMDLLFEGLDGAREIVDSFARDLPPGDAARSIRERLAAVLAQKAPSGPSGPGNGTLYRVRIHIDAPSTERYLRALLAQTRLEEIGTIIAVRPTLEELRMQDAEFDYGVVIETEREEAEIARALSIDQVQVLSMGPQQRGEAAQAGACVDRDETAATAERGLSRMENVVRVPASKLDTMLNLVGELVVQNSGFLTLTRELAALHRESPAATVRAGALSLVASLEERTHLLGRIAGQLQDAVMKVRMLPAATVFSRFPRVIRDLAKSTGKEIRLQVTGAETEIDKKVIDRICEPLVHLVRNSVDHGIESAGERRAAGKNPEGLVRMSAFQEGDRICVEVADDGHGLDRGRILARALEKGLVEPAEAETLPDEAVWAFIFLPGFTTAESVSDISGRGIGMDVVKKFVEEMDGSLRIRSTAGVGTIVTITLPLTMAIIRALLVETSSLLYAIPITAVSEVVSLPLSACTTVRGDTVITLRQEMLPALPMRELLAGHPEGDRASREAEAVAGPVVVVRHAGRRVGIGVGRVLGSFDVVIKSLGRHYQEVEGLLGASILGNGKMAIILDVGTLLELRFGTNGSGVLESEAVPSAPAEPGPEGPAEGVPLLDDGDDEKLPSEGQTITDILSAGAISASRALSGLLHEEVRVTFPDFGFVPLAEVAERLGGEETPVVRIYVGQEQGITGGHLVVIGRDRALLLCDSMMGRPQGTTASLGEEELSSLSELGNLLSASFLNAMADQLGISLDSQVPDVQVDLCLASIDAVLARFQEPGEDILLTTTEVFAGAEDQVVCHLLLFLDRESLARLRESFGAKAARNG